MMIAVGFIAVASLIALYFWSIATGRFQDAVHWFVDRFMR